MAVFSDGDGELSMSCKFQHVPIVRGVCAGCGTDHRPSEAEVAAWMASPYALRKLTEFTEKYVFRTKHLFSLSAPPHCVWPDEADRAMRGMWDSWCADAAREVARKQHGE